MWLEHCTSHLSAPPAAAQDHRWSASLPPLHMHQSSRPAMLHESVGCDCQESPDLAHAMQRPCDSFRRCTRWGARLQDCCKAQHHGQLWGLILLQDLLQDGAMASSKLALIPVRTNSHQIFCEHLLQVQSNRLLMSQDACFYTDVSVMGKVGLRAAQLRRETPVLQLI